MSETYGFKYKIVDGPVPEGVEVFTPEEVLADIERVIEENWASSEFNHDVGEWLMKQHIPGYMPETFMKRWQGFR